MGGKKEKKEKKGPIAFLDLIPKTQQIDLLNTCQISMAASSQSYCQAQSITYSTEVNTTLVVIIITRTGGDCWKGTTLGAARKYSSFIK